MNTKQIFERFGKPYPIDSDFLSVFNGAVAEFEDFIGQKRKRLSDYAQMPKANPISIEQGNYEVAKCYEFMDTFSDALCLAKEEFDREALYLLELSLFGRQKLIGKELQKEINKLKSEFGL